jgi:hypothetical protein
VGGVGTELIVIENAVGPALPAEFMAVTLMVEVPAAVGVPLSTPAAVIVMPAGRPVAPQVIGVLPLAVNWYDEYGMFTTPESRGEVEVITGATPAGLMVIENDVGPALPNEFVAVRLKVEVPAAVGVPLKRPVAESVNPAGGAGLATQVIGVDPEAEHR